MTAYGKKVDEELSRYAVGQEVHDLPEIFHVWSNQYIRPLLESYGYSAPELFLRGEAMAQAGIASMAGRTLNIVSLGCGEGALEFSIAESLHGSGFQTFRLLALDINPSLTGSINLRASRQGMETQIVGVTADLNSEQPFGTGIDDIDLFIANQSLHHMTNLETLLEAVHRCLNDHGKFVVSDMIGRNGHLRWPSAKAVLDQVWSLSSPWQRFNHKVLRFEREFLDWDCSSDGFEGVRSQDIVEVLDRYFSPEWFVAFGNLVDVYVDRAFGPNYSSRQARDVKLLTFIADLDRDCIAAGVFPPTHLIGKFSKKSLEDGVARSEKTIAAWRALVEGIQAAPLDTKPVPEWIKGRVEEFRQTLVETSDDAESPADQVVRQCERIVESLSSQVDALSAAIHMSQSELDRALKEIDRLNEELEARSTWALELDGNLSAAYQRIVALQDDLAARTDWALGLDRQILELQEAAKSTAELRERLTAFDNEDLRTRISRVFRPGR
jgi:SAM-dependent methyltransferase